MDFWCLRGPISVVLHPVFLLPSGTIQKGKCGRLTAQMLQWKNVGEPDVRGTSPEWRLCNRESQHMLEGAGFLTKLWICSMVLAHIQVKMPVQIKRQNGPVIISVFYWVSLKKKESFGGGGANWSQTWYLDMDFHDHFRRKKFCYFKSRYHIMFQMVCTHSEHRTKGWEVCNLAVLAEWVCQNIERGIARMNAKIFAGLSTINNDKETGSDATQVMLKRSCRNHLRPGHIKLSFVSNCRQARLWKSLTSSWFRSA